MRAGAAAIIAVFGAACPGCSTTDCEPAVAGVEDVGLPDDDFDVRLNKAAFFATHNSYWVHRDGILLNVADPLASGTEERILDQLLMEHVRSLEFDVHIDTIVPWLPFGTGIAPAHDFIVQHTFDVSNSFCSPLSECMSMLRTFHYAVPMHEPVILVIELKDIFGSNFDAMHTVEDLDRIFEQLSDDSGSWLYRPSDLLATCVRDGGIPTLHECVSTPGWQWPLTRDLRGKFIVTVIGNWRTDLCTQGLDLVFKNANCPLPSSVDYQGHGPAGWVDYASADGGMAARAAFPMRSVWVNYNADAGTEQVPPDELSTALNNSVFAQVQDFADPTGDWYKSYGLVRIDHSFDPDAQAARVDAGYQLLQTDFPWLQLHDQGPDRPLHELANWTHTSAEPGLRLMLRGWSEDSDPGAKLPQPPTLVT